MDNRPAGSGSQPIKRTVGFAIARDDDEEEEEEAMGEWGPGASAGRAAAGQITLATS